MTKPGFFVPFLVFLTILGCIALVVGGIRSGRDLDRSDTVRVRVTDDFGTKRVDSATFKSVPEGETVLELMEQRFEVKTGGDSSTGVRSIEGLPASGDNDWSYFVNGIEVGQDPARRKVTAGDQIWWDRRDRRGAERVPAVVGAFPEPFIHGTETKRAPLTMQCNARPRDCDQVQQRLEEAEVVGVGRTTGTGTGTARTLVRVLVGPWSAISNDPAARLLETGPSLSGVFAKPTPDGRSIAFFDGAGKAQETLRDGVGLIAATRFGGQQPTWLVTGTDTAGVAAAASVFTESALAGNYAIAVTDGRPFELPLADGGAPADR